MLCLAMKKDKLITIQCPDGSQIVLRCYDIGPTQVKIGFSAPRDVKILRNELIEETPREDEEPPIVNPEWVRGAQEAKRTKR